MILKLYKFNLGFEYYKLCNKSKKGLDFLGKSNKIKISHEI